MHYGLFRIFTLVFMFIIRSRFPKLKPISKIIRYRYSNYVLKFIKQSDPSCFTLIGSASNDFHLKLKESILILKLKTVT